MDRWTYQAEYVKCGKACCRSCPHGPYWYSYRHRGGYMNKRYHGRQDPRVKPGQRQSESVKPPEKEHPHDAIFNRRTATRQLALIIMGLLPIATWDQIHAQYKQLCMVLHPDRGGSTLEFQRMQAAYSYLKSLK